MGSKPLSEAPQGRQQVPLDGATLALLAAVARTALAGGLLESELAETVAAAARRLHVLLPALDLARVCTGALASLQLKLC